VVRAQRVRVAAMAVRRFGMRLPVFGHDSARIGEFRV
jgi:hypothetical protein